MAYNEGGADKIQNTSADKAAKSFFEKYKTVIDAQEEKKLGYTRKAKELFTDPEFFAFLCGKPFVKEPYATPKHLARSVFTVEDPVKFSENFDRYIKTLLDHRKTNLHPEIVEDLLKRLVKEVKNNEQKRAFISAEGQKMLKSISPEPSLAERIWSTLSRCFPKLRN